jgi:hypothetical protein
MVPLMDEPDRTLSPSSAPMARHSAGPALLLLAALAGCTAPGGTPPPAQPPGAAKAGKTEALEAGAALLQTRPPVRPLSIYLVGFHAAKDDPSLQMEAHHFCRQVNEEFAQCVLFDDYTEQANLIGIEYIISERLFDSLPKGEQKYWHPHNYEILSGQLAAPAIPAAAEKELMRGKMNSYGKTWHVWNSAPFERTGDRMPVGDAMLEWSFNRDGEALPGLVEGRDRRLGMDTARNRSDRADLVPVAKPQSGVDALKGRFGRPATPIPGVEDRQKAGSSAGKGRDTRQESPSGEEQR